MISDSGAGLDADRERECFVYLQLPGSLETVTCGRFQRQRSRTGGIVGRFVYGRMYRTRGDAVPIDPYHLPLQDGEFATAALGGMFGAIRDASPDSWGRRLIERELHRTDLDEMDYLLHSPEDRAGALSFGLGQVPPAPTREFNRVIQLAELLELARAMEDDVDLEQLRAPLRQLALPGTSMGGARPKNVVEDDDGLWVAKFPERGDRWDNAIVERAMLALAERCGIRVPPTRIEHVAGNNVLLVKRFDRERTQDDASDRPYLRFRMVSALTVLDADESPTARDRWSYLLLADELQRWSSHPRQDREELFRRMTFNALISNLDDHPRNHALIAANRDWRLAPAYDLTPSPTVSQERELAMTCGAYGRLARRDNLVSRCERFGIALDAALAIVSEMQATILSRWEAEIRRAGGSERNCERVRAAFVYEGFEYPASP